MTLLAGLLAAGEPQPLLLRLHLYADDHINIQVTEDRVRRTLAMVESLRREYPDSGLSVLYEFTGATSNAFQQRAKASGLLDALKRAAARGEAEFGYNGYHEPTPQMRPRPNLRGAGSGEDRWLRRLESAELFLREYKDELRGTPDPSRTGGLKKTLEVFGNVVSVRGVELDVDVHPEVAHLLRRWMVDPIVGGLVPADAYFRPGDYLPGYGGEIAGVAQFASPEPDCAPELFWMDGLLHLSETSGEPVRIISAMKDAEVWKGLEKIGRDKIHVLQAELSPHSVYVKQAADEALAASPILYTYTHWKLPAIPEEIKVLPPELDGAYARQEAALRTLLAEILQRNPASRIVSSAALQKFAASMSEPSVPKEKLDRAVNDLWRRWGGNNHPPEYAFDGEGYYSLADMFQMLAVALADRSRGGALPAEAPLRPVVGPIEMTGDQGPSLGEVAARRVAERCQPIADSLADFTWKPLPANHIPTWIDVDGFRLNAAQWLRLMSEAYLAPDLDRKLRVRTCQMSSGPSYILPRMWRSNEDMGSSWTFKPARLRFVE